MNNNTDVNGNKDAVAVLESFLQHAKTEGVGYIAIVGVKEPASYIASYAGTTELEKIGLQGLQALTKQVEGHILNRTVPDPDPRTDASYACYNVTQAPLSFDFTTWIIDREMNRIRQGAPAPLKVGFWFGRDGNTGLEGVSNANSNRQRMLDKVCRPALQLLGAVEDPMATKGQFLEFFSYKGITEGCKAGEIVPKYRTNKTVPIAPGYVTITLREVDYWPHRNSRMNEWFRFAEFLKQRGERIIFVRDTAKADEPIPGYATYPEAAKDLETRLALYQGAKCNLFVANGPVNLCFFSDCPFLDFMPVDDQGAYNAGRSDYWRTCAGIEPGEQFPWFNENQKIIWKPDYYTNLVVAWEENFGSWKEKNKDGRSERTKKLSRRK